MNLEQISSGTIAVLGFALIYRLYRAELFTSYLALVSFAAYQAFVSVVALCFIPGTQAYKYYLGIYCALMAIGWVVTLGVVFHLLRRMLHTLPGILRLSKIVLQLTFAGAFILGAISLITRTSSTHVPVIIRVVSAVMTVERAVSMIALLMLVGVVAFLSWFKIQMPRNLIFLIIGLLVLFTLRNVDYLCQAVLPANDWATLVQIDAGMTILCYLSWLCLLSSKGEVVPAQIGSHWNRLQQERVVHDLEMINRNLARRTQRPA